jgi:hypothetical protein
VAWAGKTFLLDTPQINASAWTQPKGIGSDLGAYVPQFLIAVAAGAGDALTVTLATASDGTQDACNPTTQVTMSGASAPSSTISVDSVPLRIKNPTDASSIPQLVTATAHNFTLTNILPGTSGAPTGTLDAVMDIADLYPLFYVVQNPTKDTVCTTLEALGTPCQVCAHNGLKYCMTLHAVQIGASESSTSVKAVSTSDIPSSCQ